MFMQSMCATKSMVDSPSIDPYHSWRRICTDRRLGGNCFGTTSRERPGCRSLTCRRDVTRIAQNCATPDGSSGFARFNADRISTGVTSGKSFESVSPEAPHSKSCHECKRSLERTRDEVSRLTSTFEDVRKLAGLQQPARDVTTFALSPVVTDSLQNLGNDFCAGDITVVMDACPDEDPRNVMVKASVSRLSAAIRLVLTALAKCLEAGGRIRVSIDTSDTMQLSAFVHQECAALRSTTF